MLDERKGSTARAALKDNPNAPPWGKSPTSIKLMPAPSQEVSSSSMGVFYCSYGYRNRKCRALHALALRALWIVAKVRRTGARAVDRSTRLFWQPTDRAVGCAPQASPQKQIQQKPPICLPWLRAILRLDATRGLFSGALRNDGLIETGD